MRSLLFVPGDSKKKMEKALTSGADTLILDLEDSVAPSRKEEARRLTRDFLDAQSSATGPALYVRVNALDTGLAEADLAAIMPGKPAGIMLPKSESGEDVARLAVKLRVNEAENGIDDGATAILPIITETARAVLAAATYRGATSRLSGLTWGAEDLSADIGARLTRGPDGRYTEVFRLARSLTLLAANAAGVAAIDTVFPDFRSEGAFRADCLAAERDGFTGRMAIHPAQVPIINETFTPAPEAVAQSQRIVEAFAGSGETGVIAIDGQMIDRPHVRRAERILARARLAGII
ncbi:HpcH/HpaI aldolase/citrate lyase family protein [Nitratireductor luteus]|uniref:HpcH/HpaI aldolase/citrate lyase family protein n=1 Tax=Nitratireductor luteus TaxID=2976980 RepID=UPI00223FC4E5|nr:CoA ester lyase [Nitratireductor luteus]